MAEKRMLSKKVLDTDAFLDMPLSAQALYFHLVINADDEGFVGNPKRIRDYIGAAESDLDLLIEKRFVLMLKNSVAVIRHWKIHNTLRRDLAGKRGVCRDGNIRLRSWQPDVNRLSTRCQPKINLLSTE